MGKHKHGGNGSGGTLPKEVYIERERQVWEMRQLCYTHERIGVELGLTRSAVTKILGRIVRRHLQFFDDEVRQYKMTQVAQLERIAEEAMRAWEQSQRPATSKTTKTGPIKTPALLAQAKQAVKQAPPGAPLTIDEDGNILSQDEVTQQEKIREGDPRYLQIAMQAMEDIRKILGLNAPVKVKMDLTKLSDLEFEQVYNAYRGGS